MPNESELDEAFSTIDYDKMGADAYEKAQEKIWEDWDARSNAYYDALKALRSKGTSYPAAFLHFTQETGTLLSAEENTRFSRPQTCISPLRCSARRRTATAARSFIAFRP